VIVVDATVWVDYLIDALSDDHRQRLLDGAAASPSHVDFEVGSALLRRERRGELDVGTSRALVTGFSAMPFPRERDPDDLIAAFDLIDNATYADAVYVAMADRLKCPVMTCDSGMAECARIAGVDVMNTRDDLAVRHQGLEPRTR
jgi:predicted nucleic acid-binding protein